jgi:hypothetical protein
MKSFILKTLKNLITYKRGETGRQSFLLACMPKSGSSWISRAFDRMPNCKQVSFVPAYGAREQEIDTWTINYVLFRFSNLNTIAQTHVKYNVNTKNCLIRHGIRPIILTRNIKDNLVSMVDHWRREDSSPMSSGYIERNYFNEEFTDSSVSSSSPLEYAVILHGPWILNFYLSWKKYDSNPAGKLPDHLKPIFINYEDFVDNSYESFASLYRKLNLKFNDKELQSLIRDLDSSKKIRKNVGIKGRGEMEFSKDEKATHALNRLLNLYQHEDLSGIGVD